MSVLIVHPGRSGSVWLKKQLARDKRWTVAHEHGGLGELFEPRPSIIERFKGRDFFCEITHYIVELAHHVPARKAVLIRHPFTVFESFMARSQDSQARFLLRADGMYAAMDRLLEEGAVAISFEKMTADPEYCYIKFSELGFEVDWDNVDFAPVNKRIQKMSPPQPQQTAQWVGKLNRNASWFWRKWKDA